MPISESKYRLLVQSIMENAVRYWENGGKEEWERTRPQQENKDEQHEKHV